MNNLQNKVITDNIDSITRLANDGIITSGDDDSLLEVLIKIYEEFTGEVINEEKVYFNPENIGNYNKRASRDDNGFYIMSVSIDNIKKIFKYMLDNKQ